MFDDVLGEWSFRSVLRLFSSVVAPWLFSCLIIESSSGEHEELSSSRFEWLSRWWSLPELPDELELPPELLLPPLDDCLDFSC